MSNRFGSGKLRLIAGSATYLWEELKTMNKKKFHALEDIAGGYVAMKFKRKKKVSETPHSREISLIER